MASMKDAYRGRRKLRGRRRYFARLRREADEIIRRLRSGESFDLWHHHFDLRGYGEWSARLAFAHRRLLFDTFARARTAAESSGRATQVFVQLGVPERCGQDALYCHTRPDGPASVPYGYPSFEVVKTLPRHIREFVHEPSVRVGYASLDGAEWWVVVDSNDPGLAGASIAADPGQDVAPPHRPEAWRAS